MAETQQSLDLGRPGPQAMPGQLGQEASDASFSPSQMGALWPVCLQQCPCSLLLEHGEQPGDGTSRPRWRPEVTGLGPRPPTAPPAPGTRGRPALRPAFHWGLWRMRGWVQGSRNCCAHLGPLPGPCPPRGPPPPPRLLHGSQAALLLPHGTHRELFQAGLCGRLGHPRSEARPGRSLRSVLQAAVTPSSRQLLFLPACFQGQEEGREGLTLFKCKFCSGADGTSRLKARADQGLQLRGADLGRGGSAS